MVSSQHEKGVMYCVLPIDHRLWLPVTHYHCQYPRAAVPAKTVPGFSGKQWETSVCHRVFTYSQHLWLTQRTSQTDLYSLGILADYHQGGLKEIPMTVQVGGIDELMWFLYHLSAEANQDWWFSTKSVWTWLHGQINAHKHRSWLRKKDLLHSARFHLIKSLLPWQFH